MKQRLPSVGAAGLTEDVFVVRNQMVRFYSLSRHCSCGTVHAESWCSQGQPELQDSALLVLLPAQAHLVPAGEALQLLATLCTELTENQS